MQMFNVSTLCMQSIRWLRFAVGEGYKNQHITNETVLHGSLLTNMIRFVIKISSLIMQAAIKIHFMCVHWEAS